MAIVFDEGKKFNWTALVIFAAVVLFVSFGSYFLFFTSAPAFDLILPANVQSAAELSGVEAVKADDIIRNKSYLRMNQAVIRSATVPSGRSNPFVKF